MIFEPSDLLFQQAQTLLMAVAQSTFANQEASRLTAVSAERRHSEA